MKITVNKKTTGSCVWNQGRKPGDELDIDLNIGGIDDDLQEKYIEVAHRRLSDSLSDKEVRDELCFGVWDETCA